METARLGGEAGGGGSPNDQMLIDVRKFLVLPDGSAARLPPDRLGSPRGGCATTELMPELVCKCRFDVRGWLFTTDS